MGTETSSEPTNPWWPFFDLVVRTPRLELQVPTDPELMALAALAAEGIHDPAQMPFAVPWTDAEPPALQRSTLQWHWRQRAELTSERWSLPFNTYERGADGFRTLVGMQGLDGAVGYPQLREVRTGSWLGRAHQGRGLGKEMRAAVLHLAFAGLGADVAATDAWHDNAASLAVTRSLPYRANGERREVRRGEPTLMLDFRMERADWESVRRDDIVIEGLDPCLDVLGLG
jgi:RimJ/RimL family protein N-acetyltransferase